MNDEPYKSGVWNYLGLSAGPVNPGCMCCDDEPLMFDPDIPHTCVYSTSSAIISRGDIRYNAW